MVIARRPEANHAQWAQGETLPINGVAAKPWATGCRDAAPTGRCRGSVATGNDGPVPSQWLLEQRAATILAGRPVRAGEDCRQTTDKLVAICRENLGACE